MIKLTDRVYYLPHEEETDRPVLGYVKGDNFSVAIDAGNSKRHVEKFYSELEKVGLPLPSYTVLTHWHWDHTFGMPYVHGRTIAGEKTQDKLKEVSFWEWIDKAMNERLLSGVEIPFCDEHIRKEYDDLADIQVTLADETFKDTKLIDLGGVTIHMTTPVMSHSEDSVAVYIPEESLLFIGDGDGADYYNQSGVYKSEEVEALLDFMQNLDFTQCILGHDSPITKEEELNYIKEILDDIRRQ